MMDEAHKDWTEAITGGALGALDLSFSLWAIRDFLRSIFKIRDKRLSIVEKESAQPSDDTGDSYADAANSLAFMDVACSQAAIGAIAPFAETVMKRIAAALRIRHVKPLGAGVHHRSLLPDDQYWDPTKLACRKEGPQDNLNAGFRQLLKSLRIVNKVPKECWEMLAIIREYRNAALHEGYEWPAVRIEGLLAAERKNGWDCFEVTTRGDTPWLISVKDDFWGKAIKQLQALAAALNAA